MIEPTLGTDPMAFGRKPGGGCLQTIGGFILLVFVVIVGFFMKLYWIGNNVVMDTRFQSNDVELVVLEGGRILRSLDVELGDKIAQVDDQGPFLYEIKSPSDAKYMWVEDGTYRALYGVFDSLDGPVQWAKDHGYNYRPDFELVKSSGRGITVRLPSCSNATDAMNVHVFTDRYAILDDEVPTRAQPRDDFWCSKLYGIYIKLKE